MWNHSSAAARPNPHSLRSLLRLTAPAALLLSVGSAMAAPGTPRMQAPNLPLTFEKNTGQYPRAVQFVGRTSGGTVFLTNTEAVFALAKGGKAAALRLKLTGSNAKAAVTVLEKQAGIVNYFIGNDPKKWHARVPTYARARVAGVYPGVDLVYYGAGQSRTLEYDFVVKPGADPARIRMAVSGARSLRNVAGRVVASTACGDVVLNRPYAYQTLNGKRTQVACGFTLERNTVAFQIARYDASRPLVVDPSVTYATFVGGAGSDMCTAIAVDSTGCVVGVGTSGSVNYPTTAGAYSTTKPGAPTATVGIVTKLNAAGSGLVFSTYLGGGVDDNIAAVALGPTGNVYTCGQTKSGAWPTTPGAYRTTRYGGSTDFDTVVTCLAADGAALVYSTYFGTVTIDFVSGIAVDGVGSAYVCGNFQFLVLTTPGAYQTTSGGSWDGYVAKFNPAGSALVYATALGGSGMDSTTGITVAGGDAIVTGRTASADFPTTAGAYKTTGDAAGDGFVTRLNAAGSALVASTCFGGSGDDHSRAVASDAGGNIYLAGLTKSTDLPVTAGAYMVTRPINADSNCGFVAKLNPACSSLVYSTYLGGSSTSQTFYDNHLLAIAVDASGAAYVAGSSAATTYPTTPGAHQTTHPNSGNSVKGVFSKLSADGSNLLYSTFLGGDVGSWDQATGVAVDASGVYVAGRFGGGPTTPGAYQTANGGDQDVYVVKLNLGGETSTLTVDNLAATAGARITLRAKLTKSGSAYAGQRLEFQIDSGAWIPSEILTSTAGGYATLTLTAPAAGAHTINCRFAGGGGVDGSTGAGTLTCTALVATAVTCVALTAGPADAIGLVAYLGASSSSTTGTSAIAGKQVEFQFNGGSWTAASGLTDANGKAALAATAPATAGTYTINARFLGDATYAASTGTASLTAAAKRNVYVYTINRTGKAATAGSLSAYFYWYQKNGALTPVSGKSLRFQCAGTSLDTTATTDASGRATVTVTPAAAGSFPFTVTFTADADYNGGTASGALTVAP